MNDKELRELIQQELEANQPTTVNVQDIVRTAVRETLVTMGMDASDPIQLQQDMAFVRDFRLATSAVKSKGMMLAFGIILAAVIGATWVGIKAGLNS